VTRPFDGNPDAEQWLDGWERSAAQQAEKARALADQVTGIEVSASTQDGAVQVTVGASGALVDLRLGEQIRKYPPGELAAEILAVMRRAQAQLAAQVSDIAARTLGAEDPAAKAVVDGFEQRFPAVAQADPGDSEFDWQRRRAR
jgi:DNA-binding protein YbaB